MEAIIGERSKPSVGGEWKTSYCCACPPVCSICICWYIHAIRNLGEHGRFYALDLNGRLGKQAVAVARLVNDGEYDCRFKVQREEHWTHAPAWSMLSGKGCWRYFVTLLTLMLQYALVLDVIPSS